MNRHTAVLAAAVSLFLLNDLAFLLAGSVAQWLALDYGFRMAALAVVLSAATFRSGVADMLRYRKSAFTMFALVVVLLASGYVLEILKFFLVYATDGWRLFSFPEIDSPPLYLFDMTLGLLLVAVTEEVIFRGAFLQLARTAGWPSGWTILGSSLAFGLIHWSHGAGAVFSGFGLGIVFMACVIRTGSILPTIIAHYLLNMLLFSFPGLTHRLFAVFAPGTTG